MKNLFKIIKPVLKLAVLIAAIVGIFSFNYFYQIYSSNKFAQQFEKNFKYSETLKFNEVGGNPVFWSKQTNDRTLIFFGELNNPNPIGNYYNYFKQIHESEGCNIIAPVLGIQSTPLNLRTRNWSPVEDMREAVQIYLSICAVMPEGHKIILVTKGTGNFAGAAVLANAERRPDEVIMISPVNAEIVNDDAPLKIRLASTGPDWLKFIFPVLKNSSYENYSEYKEMYAEYNLSHFQEVYKTSVMYENEVLPGINNYNIAVIWGEDDAMFKSTGYDRIVQKLMDAKNKVKPYKLKKTGYDVFQGEEIEKVKDIFRGAIRNY